MHVYIVLVGHRGGEQMNDEIEWISTDFDKTEAFIQSYNFDLNEIGTFRVHRYLLDQPYKLAKPPYDEEVFTWLYGTIYGPNIFKKGD